MSAGIRTSTSRFNWPGIISLTLGFWLSSSLLLDVVVMPCLYSAGMLAQPGFTTAGYLLFGVFNHLELLCGAIVLTGLLALRQSHQDSRFWVLAVAASLLAIAFLYTYALTPTLSTLGLQLDLFNPLSSVPAGMTQMHASYWLLELVKLGAGGVLLYGVLDHFKLT